MLAHATLAELLSVVLALAAGGALGWIFGRRAGKKSRGWTAAVIDFRKPE